MTGGPTGHEIQPAGTAGVAGRASKWDEVFSSLATIETGLRSIDEALTEMRAGLQELRGSLEGADPGLGAESSDRLPPSYG